jgi:hypothetical protein
VYTKENLRQVQEKLHPQNPDSPVPTKSCVTKLIKTWRTVGSVLDKTRHRRKAVLTDEKLEDILAWLQISPRKSLRRLSQEAGVSADCTSKATKLMKLHLYRDGVVHYFKPTNAPQRIQMMKYMQNSLIDVQLLFVID